MDGGDFFAVVEDEPDAHPRIHNVVCQLQRDCDSALHVTGSEAVKVVVVTAMRQVSRLGNGVEVASDHNGRVSATGLCDNRVTGAPNVEVSARTERLLYKVRKVMLVVRFAGDIDECRREVDDVSREIESHVDTVAR